MAAKKTTLSNSLLNAVLRNVAYSSPASVFVALFTVNESAGSQGTEVTTVGTAYTRQSVTFSAASGGSTSNSGAVTFPVATAPYGTVTGAAVCASSTPGTDDALYFGALGTSKVVGTGDQLNFAIGALSVSES